MDISKLNSKNLRDFFINLDKDLDNKLLSGQMFRTSKDKIDFNGQISPEKHEIALKVAFALYPEVFNEKLINGLNLPDILPYKKKLEISNNLFDKKEDLFYYFFNPIFYTPTGMIHDCRRYIWLFEKLGFNLDQNVCNQILSFLEDDKNARFNCYMKDEYLTIEEEIYWLKEFDRTANTDNFNKFRNSYEQQRIEFNKVLRNYRNKKIGNIGELHLYERFLRNKDEIYFVSRDSGNKCGFDFLEVDRNKEKCIEVKTTTRSKNDITDYFEISEPELNHMKEVMDYKSKGYNTDYVVDRVFLDQNYGFESDIILSPINDDLFVDLQNNGEVIGYMNKNNERNPESGNKIFRKSINNIYNIFK